MLVAAAAPPPDSESSKSLTKPTLNSPVAGWSRRPEVRSRTAPVRESGPVPGGAQIRAARRVWRGAVPRPRDAALPGRAGPRPPRPARRGGRALGALAVRGRGPTAPSGTRAPACRGPASESPEPSVLQDGQSHGVSRVSLERSTNVTPRDATATFRPDDL